MAFLGQHEHNLDTKDRLTIPARFREALADGVVLFEELDPCVSIYPAAAYETLTERFLGTLNPLSSKARMIRRRFHARAQGDTLDSAGRVRLPGFLIEHAALEGQCIVVGVDDHLEIWNPERWAAHDAEIDAEASALAEAMASAGGAE